MKTVAAPTEESKITILFRLPPPFWTSSAKKNLNISSASLLQLMFLSAESMLQTQQWT